MVKVRNEFGKMFRQKRRSRVDIVRRACTQAQRPHRGLCPLCCRSVDVFFRAAEGIPEQFTLQNMQMLHKNKRPSKDIAEWEKKSLQLSHHPRKDDSTGGALRSRGKLTANRLAGGGEREEKGMIRVETAEYQGGDVAAEKEGRTGDGALAA
jgi:hypothetical protein